VERHWRRWIPCWPGGPPTLADRPLLSRIPKKMVIEESSACIRPACEVLLRALADFEVVGYRIRAGQMVFMMQGLPIADCAPRVLIFFRPEPVEPERGGWRRPIRNGPPAVRRTFSFLGGATVVIGAGLSRCWEATLLLGYDCATLSASIHPAGCRWSPFFSVTLRPRNGLPMAGPQAEPR